VISVRRLPYFIFSLLRDFLAKHICQWYMYHSSCVSSFLLSLVSVGTLRDQKTFRQSIMCPAVSSLVARAQSNVVAGLSEGRARDAVLYLPDSDALFDRRGAQSPGPRRRLCMRRADVFWATVFVHPICFTDCTGRRLFPRPAVWDSVAAVSN